MRQPLPRGDSAGRRARQESQEYGQDPRWPERFSLTGKRSLVIGGSGGIGKELARVLAEAGAEVAVASRTRARAVQVCEELAGGGLRLQALEGDVGSAAGSQALVRKAVASLGGLDLVVVAAGVATTGFATGVTEDDWDRVIDTNLKGAFFSSQAAAVHMRDHDGGAIVHLASVLGKTAEVGVAPYAISKAGVIHLTRVLALEWARFGIRVNALAPSYIPTEMNRTELARPEVRERILSHTPLRRLGSSRDLAGACLLLASDAGSYITGQVLYVDGGWTAC